MSMNRVLKLRARKVLREARRARQAARETWRAQKVARYTRDIVGQEMDAAFYDRGYREDRANPQAAYSSAPEDASYYESWKKVLGLIAVDEAIADFGCGSGQFALMAIAAKKKYIFGMDFSSEAIAWARSRNLSLAHCFHVGDLHDISVYPKVYDVAVCLETLEHIENDLFVLSNFRRGCHVVITVPSFALSVHVRHFKTAAEVSNRYEGLLNIRSVQKVSVSEYRALWVVDGVRKD